MTVPSATSRPPPPPPPPQVIKQGGADGLKQQLDRLNANEDLMRNSITVLQNTMHSLTAAANKLNLDMVTQKHKLENLVLKVSFAIFSLCRCFPAIVLWRKVHRQMRAGKGIFVKKKNQLFLRGIMRQFCRPVA